MRSNVSTPPKSGRASRGLGFAALVVFAVGSSAVAQDKTPPRPELLNLGPTGGQSFITKSYGALGFRLRNPGETDLEARVQTFYEGAERTQYGCDVWVPPNSIRWSWFCMGPTENAPTNGRIDLKTVLLDRTGGKREVVKSVNNQPLTSTLALFEGHDQVTTVMLDSDVSDGLQSSSTPEELTRAAELRELVQVMRHDCGLSARLNGVRQQYLPPIPEAYEGIDQFVLASDRLNADLDGRRALRAWLERGGRLWIPLDLVQQSTVTNLLGDILNLQIVDRTSLSSVRFEAGPGTPNLLHPETAEFEKPVDFVRVLAPQQHVFYTVNGWPAAFLTEVGQGSVLFTTLNSRAWTRTRVKQSDPPSRYQEFPALPISRFPLEFLAEEVLLRKEKPLLSAEDLRPYVTSQIGYQVVGRTMVLLVFALLFVGLIGASIMLTKRGMLEYLGWLGPMIAAGGALAFVALGQHSRSAVPPTVAVAQIVEAEPGTGAAQASGLIGVYQSGSEASTVIGAEEGGRFDLDLTGLEGRVYSHVQTDFNRWHWENLELPSGVVRLAPFKYSIPLHKPITATVRFGAEGVLGQVQSGPFDQLEDALLTTPGQHGLPVELGANGTFRAAGQDSQQTGQLLASGLLSDRQRARQTFYQKLLTNPQPHYVANRSLLLAWSDPLDMHFNLVDHARTTGSALVAIPLQFERTPPNSRVTVPSTFVECLKISPDGRPIQVAFQSRSPAIAKLRFQIPASVRPLTIESAKFAIKLHTPLRNVAVSGIAGGTLVPLRTLSSPDGVEQLDIIDARCLQTDAQGAVYVNVDVGVIAPDALRDAWHIDWASLEVHGRTNEYSKGEQ